MSVPELRATKDVVKENRERQRRNTGLKEA
jgi:hypothetical protein